LYLPAWFGPLGAHPTALTVLPERCTWQVFNDVTAMMDGMFLTKDGAMGQLQPGEGMPAGAKVGGNAYAACMCIYPPCQGDKSQTYLFISFR
jgi:hypothetical protein